MSSALHRQHLGSLYTSRQVRSCLPNSRQAPPVQRFALQRASRPGMSRIDSGATRQHLALTGADAVQLLQWRRRYRSPFRKSESIDSLLVLGLLCLRHKNDIYRNRSSARGRGCPLIVRFIFLHEAVSFLESSTRKYGGDNL